MNTDAVNVDDVFGVAREVPLNYVSRDAVDQALVDNLSRSQHIVIFGGSKQGKTCLRKHCLGDNDYILVQCSNKWSVADINANILKRAGFEVQQSTTKSTSGRYKIVASIKAAFLGSGASGGAEAEEERSTEDVTAPLELDPEDVNDVIAALQSIHFKRFIVLEDFHYLTPEVQKDFSVALKAFHEASKFCFIIVGVWLEENRLIVYNGDLTGRIVSVDADRWGEGDLRAVIFAGSELLNIEFDDDFVRGLLANAYDSVAIVQECCRKACRNQGVYGKRADRTVVAAGVDPAKLIKEAVDQQSGRYQSFLTNFADGFQQTRLEMYRWLLHPIITCDSKGLEAGLSYSTIRAMMQETHPEKDDLNPGNITQALQSAASLQVLKGITPIVIDYDTTSRKLYVVDRGFLIWRAQQTQQDLLDLAGLPSE